MHLVGFCYRNITWLATYITARSRRLRGLKRKSAPACLLGLRGSNTDGGIDFWSLVSVVLAREISLRPAEALVQRSPTKCGVSEYDKETSCMRPWPKVGLLEKIYDLSRFSYLRPAIHPTITEWPLGIKFWVQPS